MVYSRNFYINAADTSLIFFGTTIVAGSGGGGSFVTLPQLTDSLALYATKVQLSDSMATVLKQVATDLTLTGDGTGASPLKVDTSVIATVSALRDSLAGIISSVSTDVTLTGDGSVGNPLKVDTTTYIATKGDLNLYYLASNPNGYTSDTGTVTSVAASAGTGINISGSPITGAGTLTITNTAPDQTVSLTGAGINAVSGTYPSFTITGTEVDGSVTNEIQDISTTGAAGNISISSGSTLNLNVDDADASATNEGSLTVGAGTASTSVISSNTSGSTDVTLTAGTNVTLSETGNNITISATGGGASYNNISETADTVYISDYLDVDTSTLYVDAANNRVGIGTSSPSVKLKVEGDATTGSRNLIEVKDPNYDGYFGIGSGSSSNFAARLEGGTSGLNGIGASYIAAIPEANDSITAGAAVINFQAREYSNFVNRTGASAVETANVVAFNNFSTNLMLIKANGDVGIGTTSPSYKLDVVGDINASGEVRNIGVILTSDIRYKKDLSQIVNATEKINLLNPISYYWNDLMLDKLSESKSTTKESIKYGLVAQEVEAIMPEFVSEGQDGFKAIDYQAIITLLIASEKEQQSIIESQATEIEQLKTQIQLILQEIQILKNN